MFVSKFKKWAPIAVCSTLLVLSACSSNGDGSGSDGGTDSTSDAGTDGADSGDAGNDAGTDTDGGMDSGTDTDGGMDSGTDTDGGTEGGGDTDAGSDGSAAIDYLFVATQTPSYDSGQIERFSVGASMEAQGATPATGSDIRVRSDGTSFYQIGRFNLDSITKFAATDPGTALFQYSVLNGGTGTNPYDIVFASDTKAYVILYGSSDVLIVNPSAASEGEFITGTLDLSAYDDDGAPNANGGMIIDNRLFIVMERLETFSPTRNGYIAVFDTTTDTEIDTQQGTDGLLGIALPTIQPGSLQHSPDNNELLLLSRGNIFESADVTGDAYQGGIHSISLTDYTTELLLDDGDATTNNGFFLDMLVTSADKAYLSTYDGFGITTLRSFNPTTGVLNTDVVGNLADVDLSGMAIGPAGRAWFGLRGDAPGLRVIEPLDDSIVIDLVPTALNPIDFVFIEDVQ